MKKNNDKVVENLKKIVEKAIKLQIKKIVLRQDNFFKLEGQIKSIFQTTQEFKTAMLRIRVTDTQAHQSTVQARAHFAEFGISTAANNLKACSKLQMTSYP